MKNLLLIFLLIMLVSCSGSVSDSHYSADNLKLQATKFLLSNIDCHRYYAEQPELYSAIDSLNLAYSTAHRSQFEEYRAKYDSVVSSISDSETISYEDSENLSADFLKNHIDNVFVVFDRSPWRKYLSFNDFCENLLPYCISDEKRESWIPAYREVYEPLITEAFKEYERRDTTLSSIFNYIRSELERRDIARIYPDYQWLNHYSPTTLLNVRWGSCNNFAFFLTFLLRSAGIPATIDSAPQWGAYSSGHSWNVIFDESGKAVPCDIETRTEKWKIDERIELPRSKGNFNCLTDFSRRENTLLTVGFNLR